jgi:hypothetical protein
VYLLKIILHDWADAEAISILRTCRLAMAAAARLVCVERVIEPGNGPDPGKYTDLQMLLMFGGQERTAEEFASLYESSGFRLTRIIPTAAGVSLIEGEPV